MNTNFLKSTKFLWNIDFNLNKLTKILGIALDYCFELFLRRNMIAYFLLITPYIPHSFFISFSYISSKMWILINVIFFIFTHVNLSFRFCYLYSSHFHFSTLSFSSFAFKYPVYIVYIIKTTWSNLHAPTTTVFWILFDPLIFYFFVNT